MKIALAQMDVKAGRPKVNVDRMLEMIKEAKNNGADLIAFPEMAVGGYLIGDKWTDDAYIHNLMLFNEVLAAAAVGIIVIYGNVFIDRGGLGYDGRVLKYNAAYICQNGEINDIVFKTNLPTYRIFDDKRYFMPGNELSSPRVVKINGGMIGVEICEDMWPNYDINVTEDLIMNGADFIINISSSPWSYGKDRARDKVISGLKLSLEDDFVPFYYVNACGVQNNGKNIVTFDGDSRAYNNQGEKLEKHLEPYEEGILYFDKHMVDEGEKDNLVQRSKIEEKYNAIIRAYKGMDEMMGWKPNYVFGLSGGIDSSLAVTLAVQALGKDRVKGYNLPSKYNGEATKNAAYKLAKNLGIEYNIIPIGPLVEENISSLANAGEVGFTSLVEENIQAKIRGTTILSNLAALNNGVMTNNGNKLEIALGYYTYRGDDVGLFCPLGDLTKVEVFDMARFINKRDGETIPWEMIPDENYKFGDRGIRPSAELKDNQYDPMIFGYHDRMLEMVMDYNKKSIEDFACWYAQGTLQNNMELPDALMPDNIDDPEWFINNLEWFFGQIQKSVFKRIQAPPIVITSKTAYGYDYRESQFAFETSLEYDRIKEIILKRTQGE